MTLSRERDGTIYFECDGKRCAEIFETDTKNFEEARDELNHSKWTTRCINYEWLHVCPDCQEREYGLAL